VTSRTVVCSNESESSFSFWRIPPANGIEKIILCGGDSNLIGLTDYLSVSMRHKVEVANVWINITNVEKNIPKIDFKKSLSFTTALGLALGDFNYD